MWHVVCGVRACVCTRVRVVHMVRVVWCGKVWCGVAWHAAWHVAWRGVVCDVVWRGMVCDVACGVVCDVVCGVVCGA